MDALPKILAVLQVHYFIPDSLEQSGFHVLKAFAQHAVDRKKKHVHILCYEYPTIKMKNELRNSGEDHVHFHDCFTDHRGWIESKCIIFTFNLNLTFPSHALHICDGALLGHPPGMEMSHC
jgi:hypothetical protein